MMSYIVVSDQMTYETGNNNLIPEISDKIEFYHSFIKEKVQIKSNMYYNITHNYIAQISTLQTAQQLIESYANGNISKKSGIDLDATYKIGQEFSVNPGFSIFHIIRCSGASNTGQYTDEVARKLSASGNADMICLAKVAIMDQPLIKKIKELNTKIVVLDGCPFNCAEKILGDAGITDVIHLNTTDFDIIKGKTQGTEEKVDEIIEHIKNLS